MGHRVVVRLPVNSIHVPPYASDFSVCPSGTPEALRAPALAELVRSSRR